MTVDQPASPSFSCHAAFVIESLRQLGRPKPFLVGTAAQPLTDQELRKGVFVVERKPVMLRPPVDWTQDPFLNRSWCFQLNTLAWLKPSLLNYARSGSLIALTVARDLVIDWARAHLGGATRNDFAWYDMVVGLRSPYIAYVLRACLVENMLDEHDAKLLLDTAERHGAELAKEENYSEQHNHGLFQDEGLYLLAQQLPALDSAPDWKALALTRLRATLGQTICMSEGGHLEHSSSYQFSITALVSRLAKNVPELDGLPELRDRLEATSRWHVTPSNRMAQLGDTDDLPAPDLACPAESDLHGLKALFDTGRAFVRDGASYLAVSAAYHSTAHKQADDTGFLLIEDGTVVLGDAGRWGYHEKEPDRIYARSAAAHNVLAVDDLDFQWRQAVPYGSGLVAAGQNGPWYGLVVRNPTLHQQGVDHRRLLLYRPRHALLIVDEVASDESHDYVRHFHFGPEVSAVLSNSQVALSAARLSATLASIPRDSSVELHRGIGSPKLLGWTYPAGGVRAPVSTAVLRTHAKGTLLAASLRIAADTPELTAVESVENLFLLEFDNVHTIELEVDPLRKDVRITLGGNLTQT